MWPLLSRIAPLGRIGKKPDAHPHHSHSCGPADPRVNTRLQSILSKSGLADVPLFTFADAFEDRLRFEIDTDWQGELPRTLLIDATGATTVLSGVADMTFVNAWIAQQR